jgi:hypothetical protein
MFALAMSTVVSAIALLLAGHDRRMEGIPPRG